MSEPEIYEKLAKQSRRAALLSLAGALVVLGVLLYSGFKLSALRRQTLDAEVLLRQRRTELGDVQKQLDQKQAELYVKDMALSVVREKRPGPRPRITFYRSSVAEQINDALGQLGFDVQQSEYPGNPALRDNPQIHSNTDVELRRRTYKPLPLPSPTRAGWPSDALLRLITSNIHYWSN